MWGGSPRLRPAWLCDADHFAPPACPLPEENGKRREGAEGATLAWGSEGGDVVECVVQFLADGLVLHLLCIDFVWGVQGRGQVGECGEGTEGKRKGGREGNGKREQESERGGQRWSDRNRPENRLDSHEGSLLPSLYSSLFPLEPKLVLPLGPPTSPRDTGHSALNKQECLLQGEGAGARKD